MDKIFNLLRFIIPVAIIYFVFKINMKLGIILILVVLAVLILIYRYMFYYMKGSNLYNSGDIDKAFKYFTKAVKIRTCSENIRHSYAYLLLKNERFDESEEMFDKLLKKNLKKESKNNIKITYSLLVWKKGKLKEAIEILKEIYKEYKCTVLYENLGYLLILDQKYEEAFKVNKEGYEYNSSSKTICDNLGESYYIAGEYEKAYEIYETLINNDAKFIEAFYHYGLVLDKLGRKEEALENLNKALEFKESNLSEVNYDDVKQAIEAIKSNRE